MWVLLIEDDAATARSIELMLKSEGHDCDIKRLGEDGLAAAKLYDYDVILLDLMLPDVNGLEVLRRLRACKVKTPVLILSGMDDVSVKSEGLNIGADDYLVKPLDNRELMARIEAVLRRSKGSSDTVIHIGVLSVNLDSRSVKVSGKRVHVTNNEYRILELLSERKGKVLSKEMFLNHLYGGMDVPDQKIIDVFICKLRKKITTATGGENYIETVWGHGYMLREPAPQTSGGHAITAAMRDNMAA
jgi:two-component system cell cycle response regulator CtrA